MLGLAIPDPALALNPATGHYAYGAIDWEEFPPGAGRERAVQPGASGRAARGACRGRLGAGRGAGACGEAPGPRGMTEAMTPLWEVFIRSRNGLAHKHAGSVHATDASMALQAAAGRLYAPGRGVCRSGWCRATPSRPATRWIRRCCSSQRPARSIGTRRSTRSRTKSGTCSVATTSIQVEETPRVLFTLRRADDALVLGHRLSEWCGRAPTPEGGHRAGEYRARPAGPGADAVCAGCGAGGGRARRGPVRLSAGPAAIPESAAAGTAERGFRADDRAAVLLCGVHRPLVAGDDGVVGCGARGDRGEGGEGRPRTICAMRRNG